MPADPPLLFLRDIHLSFGGTPLLEGADLSLVPGGRLALVGRNGSGKSTLLKVAAGSVAADGERFVQPGATLRYLAQEPDFGAFETVLDYASQDAPAHRAQTLHRHPPAVHGALTGQHRLVQARLLGGGT